MTVSVPLIIGPDEKAKLQQLRELAAQHPVDMPALMAQIKTAKGRYRHKRQMTRQTIRLPSMLGAAFFVTFSIETGHPQGIMRHMSMSVLRQDVQGRMPRPEGVWMVAEELGFTGCLEACAVWIEDLSDGGKAANIVQPIAAGGHWPDGVNVLVPIQ
jgi:hypothetical protein